jgi:hypothetical protein
MYRVGTGGWFPAIIYSALLVWILSIEIPYLLKYLRRKNWPSANATIQKGAIGRISRRRGAFIPACFIGYTFKVQEERYAGYFVLVGNEEALEKLNKNLSGGSLQIRYDPSDPNVSLLLDYHDFLFAGLTASQDPAWLSQAPSFDLQDLIRG